MLGDQAQERVRLKGLDQIIHCTGTNGIHRALHRAIGRHQQHRQMRVFITQYLQQGMAVHTRHVHVADHHGHRLLTQHS